MGFLGPWALNHIARQFGKEVSNVTNKAMFCKQTKFKGGFKMKKYSVILALALAFVMAIGISTAFAAGGTDATSDAYTTTSVNGETYVAVPGTLGDPNQYVNGARNANVTGLGNVIKNVEGQDVHGEYKKNTNSCASCHVTHNAPGENLLFKNGTYNTCTSCHDGTLSFLNVFQTGTKIQEKVAAATPEARPYAVGGGTFRYEENAGFSMHMANGAVKLSAAPGGNRTSTENGRKVPMWGSDFTCASCHAPHGGYSDRLLHYNPNNYANTSVKYTGVLNGVTQERTWGLKKSDVAVVNETIGDKVYFYVAGATAGFDNRDKTPWIYGYDSHSKHDYFTMIKVNGSDTVTAGTYERYNSEVHMNYGEGYFTVDAADYPQTATDGVIDATDVVTMDISPAMQVKFNKDGHKIVGYGDKTDAISQWCGACHTEYNTGSVSGTESIFTTESAAHRHTINRSGGNGIVGSKNNSRLECLSCHYAHGTSKEIQLYADNQFVPAADAADLNPSSALKRYINQAVCFRCHTSSSAAPIKNDAGFWNGNGDGEHVYESLQYTAGNNPDGIIATPQQ